MRPGLFGGAGGEGARKTSREPSASDDAPPSKRPAPPSPGGRRPAFDPGLLASPFYGGPTMYGGAGACNSSSPRPRYSSLFYERRKTDVKATPAKSGGAMSQTSKRIWELLAHYSTPISDAMRAPPARPPSEASDADRSTTGAPRRLRELRVPGMAALLKLKRNNRTVGSAQAAIAASLSSSLPYEADDRSASSPVRSTVAAKAKRDRPDPDPSPGPTPPPTLTSPSPFRFSAPSRPDPEVAEPPAKRFTFRDPFEASDRPLRAEEEPTKPVRLWNGTDKTSEEKKEKTLEPDALTSFLKKQRSQWECDSCMSRNDSDKAKCACCEAPKPAARSPKKPPQKDAGFATLVQQQKSRWECPSCLSRNDADKNNCACCETPKPGTETAAPPVKSGSGFATLLQKQKSQWECSSCLTRNDPGKNKCACCEAAKPGTEDATAAVKFNFGSAPSGGFKFGTGSEKEDGKKTIGGFAFGIAPTTTTVDSPKPLGEIKFGIANGTASTDSDKTKSIIFGSSLAAESDFGASPGEKTKSIAFAVPSDDKTKSIVFGTPSDDKSKSVTFGVPSDDKGKSIAFGAPSAEKTKSVAFVVSDEKPKPIVFGVSVGEKGEDPPMPAFGFGSKLAEKTPATVEPPKVALEPEVVTALNPVSRPLEDKPSEKIVDPEPPKSSAPAATASMFTFGSAKSVSAFGSAPQFNFNCNSLSNSTPKSPPESAFKPTLFNFGAKASVPIVTETEATPKDSPKVAFPAPTSPFSAPAAAKTAEDVADGPTFRPPSDEPKTASTPSFSFASTVGSPSTLSAAASGVFKNNGPSPTSLFSFGGAPSSKPESSNLTVFGSKTVAPSTNVFGSPTASDKSAIIPNSNSMFKTTPSTTAPSFSSISGSVNIFGSKSPEAANAGNLFGSPAGAESKSAPVFGAAVDQSGPRASMFSNPGSAFGGGSVFGGPQANSVDPQRPSPFDAKSEPSTGIFGSKPSAPQPAPAFFGSTASPGAPGIFGSRPAVPTPVFGASVPFGETQAAARSAPFKFGAPGSAPTPGVGFGRAPTAPVVGGSAPVFSFGSSTGTPSPSASSQFNFSMGAPTPAFPTVPGVNSGMPVRRFKKAVRRNVQR